MHNRIPVILDPDDYDAWLTAADTAIPSFPAQLMTAFPVPQRINSVKNDDAELIAPLSQPRPAPG